MDRQGDCKDSSDKSCRGPGPWRSELTPRRNMGTVSDISDSETRAEEVAVSHRYEETQQFHGGAEFQDGRTVSLTQDGRKELVGIQFRPEGRLSSPVSVRRSSEMDGFLVEKEMVPLQSVSLWSKSIPICLYQNYEGSGKILEEAGNYGTLLHRRLYCGLPLKGKIVTDSAKDGSGYGTFGTDTRPNKGSLGAYSSHQLFGIDSRFNARFNFYSPRKTGETSKEINVPFGNTPDSSKGSDSTAAFSSGRVVHQCFKSFHPSQTLYKGVVQNSGCSAPNEMAMGQLSSTDSASNRGHELAFGKFNQVQWKDSLEAISTNGDSDRCRTNWLGGLYSEQVARLVSLDNTRNGSAYKLPGDYGNYKNLSVFERICTGKDGPDSNRQYNSKGLCEQWRGEIPSLDNAGTTIMGSANRFGRGSLYGRMDPRDREFSCRLPVKTDRLWRLDAEERVVQNNRQEMGTTYSRQNGIRCERTAAKVQLIPQVSWNRGSELLFSGLGLGKQLGRSSFGTHSSSPSTHSRVSNNSNRYSPEMGISTVVADSSKYEDRSTHTSKSRNMLRKGSKWLCGTVEKERVGFLSGTSKGIRKRDPRNFLRQSGAWDFLSNRRRNLILRARTSQTNLTYQKIFDEFRYFCSLFLIDIWQPTEEGILNFLAWYDATGRGNSVSRVVAALRANFKDNGVPDFTNTFLIRQTTKGIARQAAEEKVPDEERLPLPVSALVTWRQSMPQGVSACTWVRNAAIVSAGLRLMRRPGELAALNRGDIRFDDDGWMWVTIRKSKTDQLRKGKVVPVEPSKNPRTCPVRIMKEWMDEYSRGNANAPLFFNIKNGQRMTTASISSVVRLVASHAGLKGRYTGHSLRIGGATAAVRAGMAMAMIRSIGDWESKAVLFYLRAVGAAQAAATTRMGF